MNGRGTEHEIQDCRRAWEDARRQQPAAEHVDALAFDYVAAIGLLSRFTDRDPSAEWANAEGDRHALIIAALRSAAAHPVEQLAHELQSRFAVSSSSDLIVMDGLLQQRDELERVLFVLRSSVNEMHRAERETALALYADACRVAYRTDRVLAAMPARIAPSIALMASTRKQFKAAPDPSREWWFFGVEQLSAVADFGLEMDELLSEAFHLDEAEPSQLERPAPWWGRLFEAFTVRRAAFVLACAAETDRREVRLNDAGDVLVIERDDDVMHFAVRFSDSTELFPLSAHRIAVESAGDMVYLSEAFPEGVTPFAIGDPAASVIVYDDDGVELGRASASCLGPPE
ncbi:MAG: hypothetical protein IT367_12390 [Candidatus Hydrogenedentes bacterium]|nr:hypothetical protein [Candidatus Hydrogenedentota bacterium]